MTLFEKIVAEILTEDVSVGKITVRLIVHMKLK